MAIIKRDRSLVTGLSEDLTQLTEGVTALTLLREEVDGALVDLVTTQTGSLSGAINSVVTATTTVVDTSFKSVNNLTEVTNLSAARTNLNVYSTTEVESAIVAAQEMLGSNYQVANITERDALTNLSTNDRVFVIDSGNGGWTLYKPTTFTGDVVTGWTPLMDAVSLANSIDAAGIQSAYLENTDTFVFTDVERVKVNYMTITQSRDLDIIGERSTLIQDIMSLDATSTSIPAASACVTYIDSIANEGGPSYLNETLTVVGSDITLTQTPLNGIHSILNFATVRHTDMNGIAYDAPVISTADPKVFTVATTTPDEWDGLDVGIQYTHETVYPDIDENGYADQGTLPEPE